MAGPPDQKPTGTAPDATRLSLLDALRSGTKDGPDRFVAAYEPLLRAYLRARWAGGRYAGLLEDGVQEALLDCLRPGGAMERYDPAGAARLRSYLYSVVRYTALRLEKRERRDARKPIDGVAESVPAREARLSRVFDRAWANLVLQRAARRMREDARGDEEAVRRWELLQLRFGEDLPIRDIATRWDVPAEKLHRAYARARKEFEAALRAELAEECPGIPPGELGRECEALLELCA
ncbi:MAG: sigma-70 family RNA polymerase sigma factor [Planctomycetota bacterium]